MHGRVASLALVLVMLAATCPVAEMLVWDNDNGKTFANPDGSGYVGCEYAVVNALQDNGHPTDVLRYLPSDVSAYEAIFIVLGWC